MPQSDYIRSYRCGGLIFSLDIEVLLNRVKFRMVGQDGDILGGVAKVSRAGVGLVSPPTDSGASAASRGRRCGRDWTATGPGEDWTRLAIRQGKDMIGKQRNKQRIRPPPKKTIMCM